MYKKHSRLLLLILPALIFLQCAAGRKTTYTFPPEFPAEKKKEVKEKAIQGEALYKIHCADCHGIFTGGKDKIPNFTATQIDNYSAKFLRHDPKNHAIAQKMSPDQLNDILMFLRYRKINNQAN